MRPIVLCLMLLLAACDSPAPRFMGAERFEVSRDGRNYVLYRKGNEVEVIRMGYARRKEHREIHATMIDLIGVVTGCRPVPSTIQGDSGEIRARITCR